MRKTYKVVRESRVWDSPLTKAQANDMVVRRNRENPEDSFSVKKMNRHELKLAGQLK